MKDKERQPLSSSLENKREKEDQENKEKQERELSPERETEMLLSEAKAELDDLEEEFEKTKQEMFSPDIQGEKALRSLRQNLSEIKSDINNAKLRIQKLEQQKAGLGAQMMNESPSEELHPEQESEVSASWDRSEINGESLDQKTEKSSDDMSASERDAQQKILSLEKISSLQGMIQRELKEKNDPEGDPEFAQKNMDEFERSIQNIIDSSKRMVSPITIDEVLQLRPDLDRNEFVSAQRKHSIERIKGWNRTLQATQSRIQSENSSLFNVDRSEHDFERRQYDEQSMNQDREKIRREEDYWKNAVKPLTFNEMYGNPTLPKEAQEKFQKRQEEKKHREEVIEGVKKNISYLNSKLEAAQKILVDPEEGDDEKVFVQEDVDRFQKALANQMQVLEKLQKEHTGGR